MSDTSSSSATNESAVAEVNVATPVASSIEEPTVLTSAGGDVQIQQQELFIMSEPPAKVKKSFFDNFNFFSKKDATPVANSNSAVPAQLTQQKFQKAPAANKAQKLFTSKPSKAERPVKSSQFPRRIMTDGWDTKPPCAVIVTIYSQSSYDALFRSVPQQSPDPESSIAVFEMDYETIPLYLQYIANHGDVNTSMMPQDTIDAIRDMTNAIENVENDAVVFNFECCGFCNDNGFQSHTGEVHRLLKMNIDAGYMTMFGDFSVKALIASWDTTLFGPKPFERVSSRSCSSSMLLAFDCAKLLECPSAQLQNVGKLHEGINTAELHCLGGTVVFTMDGSLEKSLQINPMYQVDVLTIATKIDGDQVTSDEARLTIDRYSGHAGHVLLTYNNEHKGKILVSAGHWIELSQMGAETERVFTAMREQYGEEYEQQLRTEYSSAASEEMRSNLVQRSARQLVQSSAPCKYARKKI